ncbi:MAG: HAD family phosphatase [Clostridia bacterium]|nr:HAD family phosphatase [Clostridia bacterium]
MSFIHGGTLIRPVSAVLFDMDGLLIDSERLALECDRCAFEAMGIPMDYSVLLQTLGETAESSNRIFASHIDGPFDTERFWALTRQFFDEKVQAGELEAKPGARELIYFLGQNGIPCALGSSSALTRISVSLQATGLDRFTVIVCGDDPVRSKPEPDIFLLAAERLGICPEHCLVLEDSPSGIRAGFNGGMQVCMIPDLIPWQNEFSRFCHHACTGLADIQTLLKEPL